MPTYCYRRRDNGEIVERVITVAQMIQLGNTLTLEDGVKADRDIPAEMSGVHATPGAWPMESRAAGVNPDQIPQAREYAASLGVPTQFTKTGAAIFTDRQHRAKFLRAHGMFDQQAGYGDPARGSWKG